MKAYRLHRYGGPEAASLDEVAEPAPRPRDLLVRVAGMGLNPVDYKIRDGMLKTILKLSFPATLGNELSGEVVSTGSAVTRFKPGDKVIARVEKDRLGAFAEMACIDESVAVAAPVSVDLAIAAGLPLAGLTALQALRDELDLRPGQHVLITAGAGGVGIFAIQLAKWLGAEVTTTASPRGDALVRDLGADHVIDYTTTDLAGVGRKFDAAFDLAGGDALNACFALVKPGGTVLSVAGMPEPLTASKDLGAGFGLRALFWLASFGLRRQAAANGVRYRYLFMRTSAAELAELAELVDTGKLRIIIDSQYRFDQIAEAIAHLEAGRAKGKVVVTA